MRRQWIGLAFVIVVIAFFAGRFLIGPKPFRDALAARELATRGLAEAIVDHAAVKRALVLSNPFVRRSGTEKKIIEMEEAGLRGLRAALTARVPIGAVVYPDLRPEARENPRAVPIDAETTTPLSYLMAEDAVDHAVQTHPDCDVIVSLIGLPIELDHCEAWKKEGGPTFALLLPDLRMVGGVSSVVAAVKSGKIIAMVLRKPNGVGDDVAPGGDAKVEFANRFVLVTRENVEEIARSSPEILQGTGS